jgi:HPt (histidine-containing phosphotransfer) domain-containing protein
MLTTLGKDALFLMNTRLLRTTPVSFMPNNTPDMQEKFRQLQQQYAANLPEKIAALERDWQAVIQNQADTTQYQTLIRAFHTLAGSGGSYGFPAITNLCREIEDALESAHPPLTAVLKLEIDNKLVALKQAARTGPASRDSDQTP